MEFYKKYRHVGNSYGGVSIPWIPTVEKAIIEIERVMWPKWIPLFIKRFIHQMATGGSTVRVRSKFWNKIRDYLTGGNMIVQIKDKYAGLRFYMRFYTHEIDYIIEKTKRACSRICERCGHEGDDVKVSGQGWVENLCEKCFLDN